MPTEEMYTDELFMFKIFNRVLMLHEAGKSQWNMMDICLALRQ